MIDVLCQYINYLLNNSLLMNNKAGYYAVIMIGVLYQYSNYYNMNRKARYCDKGLFRS